MEEKERSRILYTIVSNGEGYPVGVYMNCKADCDLPALLGGIYGSLAYLVAEKRVTVEDICRDVSRNVLKIQRYEGPEADELLGGKKKEKENLS